MTDSGVVSNGGCFHSFGKLLPQVGKGEFLILQGLYQTSAAAFLHWGSGDDTNSANAFQSRGYPGAELEEESVYSVPMALDLSDPRS